MSEAYRIHFGFSKRSKYYPQAVELAQMAYRHEVRGEDEDAWHIATLTEDQTDLMASLYVLAVKVPLPRIFGADVRYAYAYCLSGGKYNYVHASDALKKRVYAAVKRLQRETGNTIEDLAEYLQREYLSPIQKDMTKVRDKLVRECRIDYIDPDTQTWVRAKNKPGEPIDTYRRIHELIAEGRYAEAVDAYYVSLGKKHYGVLTNELIYLKRLAGIPLSGRDLLCFRSESSRGELIASNLDEYVICVDEVLARLPETGRKPPLDILLEYAPTVDQLIEERRREWHMGVYLWQGEFKRDSTPVTLDTLSGICPRGRLFDRYPDQIQHCRIVEYHTEARYMGLWTTYSPSYYQTEILAKGLHLNGIEAYRHRSWREYRGKWRREPDFASVESLDDITKTDYGTRGIEYTGRQHRVCDRDFYEIDLLGRSDSAEELGNPLLELVEEALREAENLLRERHGIPRIGEGWISETQLYRLVQAVFPDAEQHSTPAWLRPQHLDVFVPSQRLAFEYQGRQHYEPVDFFGGQESFESTVERDRLKARRCSANGIVLIKWDYTEPIDEPTLSAKLDQAGVKAE